MRSGPIAIVFVAGLIASSGFVRAADGINVNLDALGPEKPVKKTAPKSPPISPDAVRSAIVPDDEPESPPAPKAPKAPTPVAAKPVVTPVSAVAPAPGEIDFIGRTKRTQSSSPKPTALPVADTVAAKPVLAPAMAKPIAEETALPAPTPIPIKPVAPIKPASPNNVVVNNGALDNVSGAPSTQPAGQPLTAITPNGALFVPKNVEGLPQPVSVEQPATSDDANAPTLTLPPMIQETPSAGATPPTTQSVAATAVAPTASAATPSRAAVLDGHATAAELLFQPGAETLSPAAISALDELAAPLKAANLRVQLAAYSGRPGNNSSDARRLSLKRALAVRNHLMTKGIPKASVNVVALGGAAIGQSDRVDVMVRSDQITRLTSPAQ